MPLRWPARVKAQSSTTGTGTLTLSEPGQIGWRTFTRAVIDLDLADGDQVAFITVDTTVTNGPKLLEVSVGTWNNTAKTLTRDTVYQPNSTPVSWGTGTRDVVVMDNPVMFLLLAGGTMTGILKILLSGAIIAPATETSLLIQRSASSATDCGLSVVSGTTGKARLNLGDTLDEKVGGVIYDNNINALIFRANNIEGPRVNNAGALITVGGSLYDSFASGTTMVFYQATTPTGWTKITTHNDKALRVVSGAGGGSGGSRSLSSATVGDTTLLLAQMPVHNHASIGGPFVVNMGSSFPIPSSGVGASTNTQSTTADAGSGESHSHSLALAYIDVIICSKN